VREGVQSSSGRLLVATVEQIPPKGQQTVRCYRLYSNKSRGMAAKIGRRRPETADAEKPERKEAIPPGTLFILPPPEPRSGRALRPLWRDLIMKVWGEDPHNCPCCPRDDEPSGSGSRETDRDVGVALKRSGRVREPEEATESTWWER